MINKLKPEHLSRKACIYIRQSTAGQVLHCKESQRLQYKLVERAKELGWQKGNIQVIDSDLGTTATGCVARKGFQDLLSDVCEGKIGSVFSIEASRLARNGREWHTLLEVCGVMKTLLIDQEAIYDPNISTDRMVLGLKGEMSSMELTMFRERSQAAIKEKARRGELYLTVSSGYVKTKDNQLKKDPNMRIQEVLELVFSKFREHGSIRQVYKWFISAKIEIPVVSCEEDGYGIVWKLPTPQTISSILNNPIYAGAYAYGRTKTEVEFENGVKRMKKGIRKKIEDWDVLILGHHKGYITWKEYLSNLETIANNTNKKRPIVKGSVREGEALLGGLLRCGHCGRRLFVKYQGRDGRLIRYHCGLRRNNDGEKECISFGGSRVDKAVEDILLRVLSPIGLEASFKAIEKIEEKSLSIRRQRELSLEQAHYETQRAKRQFNAVDPENRLVAANLEKEWNETLVKVAKLEEEIAILADSTPQLPAEEISEIKELGQNLPYVWNHPYSSQELKKRIVRTVIKEIVVNLKEQMIKLIIHWKGGDHTELKVRKYKTGETRWRTDVETRQIITELARIMPDKHIVSFLNRIGKRTAKELTWTPMRLCSFRKNNKIPVYREGERQERGELTVDEASSKLDIGKTKVLRLIKHKILPAKQVCFGAPWIIVKKDLETERVIKAAKSPLSKRPLSLDSKQKVLNFH